MVLNIFETQRFMLSLLVLLGRVSCHLAMSTEGSPVGFLSVFHRCTNCFSSAQIQGRQGSVQQKKLLLFKFADEIQINI